MSSSPEHKRAIGKSLKQSQIVWQLEVGPLHFRCVWTGAPRTPFTVENRGEQGWKKFVHHADSAEALRSIVASSAITGAVDLAVHRIAR